MNLTTVGSIPGSNWKRVTTHSIAVVTGMALALSAVVAFGLRTPGQISVAQSSAASAVGVSQAATSDIMASVISSEDATYGLDAAPVAQRQASMEAIMASVLSTELANFAAPAVTAKAADADIAASVLRTENALYGVQIEQRKAAEAEIAASVLSTELANFGS
jgi:hypothetical protein